MRILAGSFKGKTLFYPRNKKMRPTQGLVRAAVFNILGAMISGARVGDFFSGAGSLGIEALSRGARSVVFVDNDPEALRFLKRNLDALSVSAEIRRGDVVRIIPNLSGEQLDIVLLDPPYDTGLAQAAVEKLAESGRIAADGVIVVEHSRRESISPCPGLALDKKRVYGDTIVSILRRVE